MARSVGLPTLKRAAGVVTRRLPIPQPMLLVGPGASARLGQAIADLGHRQVLLVTDEVVTSLGLAAPLQAALQAAGVAVTVFDRVTPDAPIPVIEEGISLMRGNACDAIAAIGGGSVIDAAKAIAMAAATGKHPRELVGYFKGRRRPAPIYAVPTTAGTGSEVTVAAVISDPAHHAKLVIADTRIVPRIAALDPNLMAGLPPPITAATGMDALTHAVEAFIGEWGTEFTDRMALAAVGMIFQALPQAFDNGQDLAARERMALASTYAGLAFTRANVGNVHALAHQLGGLYHTPHGLANAMVLPRVLHWCREEAQERLAVLGVRAGVAAADSPPARQAAAFIAAVEAMNQRLGIPPALEALRRADIALLAEAACHEANFNYPVPKVMTQQDAEALLRKLLPPARAKNGEGAARAAPRVRSSSSS
ncbi:MAG: iron-containing alcohol dehydrogenase [Burkholderiales bacterium]|nr:iron-containing alcohol dehydrogenase [Burkholderiales bacterium]